VKLNPVIISLVLAVGTLGYATDASAQNPCSASYPCQKICGNHVCAPGEVYAPQGNTTVTTGTTATNATAKTNGTVAASTTQMKIGANVTAIKTTNGTVQAKVPQNNATMSPVMNSTVGTVQPLTNATKAPNTSITQHPPFMPQNNTVKVPATQIPASPPALPSPAKQVASGTAPADVKCPSGYQLALNKFDSRPACVTPDVMAKLVARGWATAAQS